MIFISNIRKFKVFLLLLLIFINGILLNACGITDNPDYSNHYMTQINIIRSDYGVEIIEHNNLVDSFAEIIQKENPDYFEVLEKINFFEIGDSGSYHVYWNFDLKSSVAEQINALSVYEQGFFVNPDAIYWGYYINPKTLDYTLVLIFDNPLFHRTESYVEEAIKLEYE